jgi:very-short-patch-repair endonuclease
MPHQRREVIPGQFVTEDKRQFARQLRQEMTPQEKKVWQAVRGRRLGGLKFRRQQVIDGYIADFYCDHAGVVLELDGSVHANQVEYDAHRDRVIASRGLLVLRLPNGRIDGEFDRVLAEIVEACRHRVG